MARAVRCGVWMQSEGGNNLQTERCCHFSWIQPISDLRTSIFIGIKSLRNIASYCPLGRCGNTVTSAASSSPGMIALVNLGFAVDGSGSGVISAWFAFASRTTELVSVSPELVLLVRSKALEMTRGVLSFTVAKPRKGAGVWPSREEEA